MTLRTATATALAALLIAASAAAELRTLHDGLGRAVQVPEDPRRIVALAPNLVETLAMLGEQSRLAGRTDGARHPSSVSEIPSVGGMARPSLEAILALRPDLVLATTEGNPPSIVERLEDLGIPVLTMDHDAAGFEGIWQATLLAGRAVGAEERAGEIVRAGRERLEAARGNAPDPRPEVLLLVWTRPMIAAGGKTYLHDLLEAAGARNLAADLSTDWPRLGRESLIGMRPDLVLVADAMDGGPPPGLEELEELPGLADRVVRVPGGALLRPSPAALEGLKDLRSAVAAAGATRR